jgi:hypothetical protein
MVKDVAGVIERDDYTDAQREAYEHRGPELLADEPYAATVADVADSSPAEDLEVEPPTAGDEPDLCQVGEES